MAVFSRWMGRPRLARSVPGLSPLQFSDLVPAPQRPQLHTLSLCFQNLAFDRSGTLLIMGPLWQPGSDSCQAWDDFLAIRAAI